MFVNFLNFWNFPEQNKGEEMLTLAQALASGRKFKRASSSGGYSIPTTIAVADVSATDYVLEPAAITLDSVALARAWDTVAGNFTSVKSSRESALFKALSEELFG